MQMKLFVAMLISCVSMSVFAVTQYGQISGGKNGMGTPGISAVVDRGGWSGGLQNTMYFNQSSYLYLSFAKGDGVSFSGFFLDGKNKGADINFTRTSDNRYTAVGADGKPLQFNPGDAVGFSVVDESGKTIYNTPQIDGNGQPTFAGTAIVNDNEYVIGFGQHGQYIGSSGGYTQLYNDSSYVMGVQVSGQAPSGQPLPGVFAALLIGGGILLLLKKRKFRTA